MRRECGGGSAGKGPGKMGGRSFLGSKKVGGLRAAVALPAPGASLSEAQSWETPPSPVVIIMSLPAVCGRALNLPRMGSNLEAPVGPHGSGEGSRGRWHARL